MLLPLVAAASEGDGFALDAADVKWSCLPEGPVKHRRSQPAQPPAPAMGASVYSNTSEPGSPHSLAVFTHHN